MRIPALRHILLLLVLTLPFAAPAQDVQTVYRACTDISRALVGGSESQFDGALTRLEKARVAPLQLKVTAGRQPSLDGHLLFDEPFLRALKKDHGVRKLAARYARERNLSHRGATSAVKMGTYVVDKKGSLTLKSSARGAKTVAVVGEPNARLTLKVTDKAGNVLYADREDVKKGRPERIGTFTVPKGTPIFITVTNRGPSAASFALITN